MAANQKANQKANNLVPIFSFNNNKKVLTCYIEVPTKFLDRTKPCKERTVYCIENKSTNATRITIRGVNGQDVGEDIVIPNTDSEYRLTDSDIKKANLRPLYTVNPENTNGGSKFKLILTLYTNQVKSGYQECAISRTRKNGLWIPHFLRGGGKKLFYIRPYPCNPKIGRNETKIIVEDFVDKN